MEPTIPHDQWKPLAVTDVAALFATAPFPWALAGGYAVEQFLGRSIRSHDDIDIVIFRDDQTQLQQWLAGWCVYAADPPGSLRSWKNGEYLVYGIHDIWMHRSGVDAWQLQVMLQESEGHEWFSRHNPALRGPRNDLITMYRGLPCVRIDVQLLYKAKHHRPKDDLDFNSCLPLLDAHARQWLCNALRMIDPNHVWIDQLSR